MSRLAMPIISPDAPLLSPVDSGPWDCSEESYGFYYPPSPSHSIDSDSPVMLKRESIETELCMPTDQVFNLHEISPEDTLSSPPDSPYRERHGSTKRSASPPPGATKKQRAAVNSKDFVPPDVSGLSKREARLVKNRAAAFLSRQRKREEFETMEVRVAELEQENARLLALTQSGGPPPAPPVIEVVPEQLLSEVEQLRAQLAAASARERELAAELAQKALAAAPAQLPIKVEAVETELPAVVAISRSSSVQSSMRSSASLGLMVLLCALPTLLSMPTHSSLPARFTMPIAGATFPPPSSTFNYNSIIKNEYDWDHTSSVMNSMDLDIDEQSVVDQTIVVDDLAAPAHKLEFVDFDAEALGGLGPLDISFDASPSDAGKIRVRIHTPELPSDTSSTPPLSPRIKVEAASSSSSLLSNWSMDQDTVQHSSSESFRSTSPSSSAGDPFLGVGAAEPEFVMGAHYAPDGSLLSDTDVDFGHLQASDSPFGYGSPSEYGGSITSEHVIGKRRVRIALKSMPTAGGEGGEWEVELR